ncbi:MAG: hypothetical protein Q9163_000690 [Psora crenata]
MRPVPNQLLESSFLVDLSITYGKSRALNELLDSAWTECRLHEVESMLQSKALLTQLLETSSLDCHFDGELSKVVPLAKSCYLYAQFLMVGSDFIDALSTASHRQSKDKGLKKLTVLAYICLTSLMKPEKPQTSLLIDHLYSLRSTDIPQMLVESTPFLGRLQGHLAGKDANAKRAKPLLESYAQYTPYAKIRRRQNSRGRPGKGKSKIHDLGFDGPSNLLHVHKMSLITQIQDLFPDLGPGFVVKLLDHYNDDTEQITADLLEDNLPQHLRDADRTELLPSKSQPSHDTNRARFQDLAPDPTPRLPPPRRNIYDDDDFDRLAIDASKLHIGRKNPDLTADELLATNKSTSHKAAILSALAAFDSDDDERDDTYDVADVGGTVDTTSADPDADAVADIKHDKGEHALFTAFRTSQAVFDRSAETRRSRQRLALKTETGMTDEAIEGWAVMARRDPKRLQRLERMHELSGGVQQQSLAGTSWKAESGPEGTEGSDVDVGGPQEASRGVGRARGRGGRGGRGSGANVAGPSNDPGTQIARQRKDASKGSRANHNRRDQRARKMARGVTMAG